MDRPPPLLGTMRVQDALARGMTPDERRGPGWTTRGYGLVRPSDVEADPTRDRIADAVGLLVPGCVLGGWSSLYLQGNRWFDGVAPDGTVRPSLVHCTAGTQLRTRELVTPTRGLLHPDEVLDLDGFPVTTMARAAYDEARLAPGLHAAVGAVDMALSTVSGAPHCTPKALHEVLEAHHKTRGLVQARRAAALATTRSASPAETRTRLIAELDVGLRGLLVNVPVFDTQGRLLGIADLLEPESGLVVETDGAHHREAQHHTDDNHREELMERVGLVVCRVTALDHTRRVRTAARIAAAFRHARMTTRHDWTLEKPSWWHRWPPGRRYD